MGDEEGDSIGEPHEQFSSGPLAFTCCHDEPVQCGAGRAAFPFFSDSLPRLDSTLESLSPDMPPVNTVTSQ